MTYPEADIQDVKDAVDLVALVGEATALKRSGLGFKGLCPFHDEKTPSFTVNADYYYCFGCGISGDAITFLRTFDGLTFREALTHLAEQYGVTLHPTEPTSAAETSSPQRLYKVNAAAAAWFGKQLLSPAGAPGRELLTTRGFDPEQAVHEFGCGWAPATGLTRHLRDHGFQDDDIKEAGLLTHPAENRPSREFFRNRLLWTIRSHFGQPIGFGARRIFPSDPMAAKFINTSETPVYQKSKALYGIDVVRKAAARTGRVVVVEGYTDVMAMRLDGVDCAVATCGTAFSEQHLQALHRLVGTQGEVIFVFDGDEAGLKGAVKAYSASRSLIYRLSCVTLPSGHDPDTFRRENPQGALAGQVEKRRPLLETVLLTTINSLDTSTIEGRRGAVDAVAPILSQVSDSSLRDGYASLVAQKLSQDPDLIRSAVTPANASHEADHLGGDTPPRLPSNARTDLLRVLLQSQGAANDHLQGVKSLYPTGVQRHVIDAVEVALWDDNPEQAPWATRVIKNLDHEDARAVQALLQDGFFVPPADVNGYVNELTSSINREQHKAALAAARKAVGDAIGDDEKVKALQHLSDLKRANP